MEAGEGTPVYDDDQLNEQDRTPVAGSSKRKVDDDHAKVPEVSTSRSFRQPKITFLQDVDSDDLDEEDFVPAAKRVKASASTSRAVSRDDTPASNSGLRGVGEFMPCGECGERFTVVCRPLSSSVRSA